MLINQLRKQLDFNETEKIIANYIISYPKDFIFESIDSIASKTYTSPATIVRFSKKLGFSGFPDLKIKIATELSTFDNFEQRIEIDMPFLPNSGTEEITESFYKLSTQVLKTIYENIDREKIVEAAIHLHQADSIVLLGVGPSQVIVSGLYYNLRRLGLNVVHDPTIGFHVQYKKKNKCRQVALIVSNFGSSNEVRSWVTQLKELEYKIILVTTNDKSPFINVVDTAIITDINENQVWKMGSFASRTALTYAIDCIFAVLFNMDYTQNVKTLYKSAQRMGYEDDIDLDFVLHDEKG